MAFGAQKIRKLTLKSRRTQNESLFGEDLGPEDFGEDFGPFIFENEQGVGVTVNGDRYQSY